MGLLFLPPLRLLCSQVPAGATESMLSSPFSYVLKYSSVTVLGILATKRRVASALPGALEGVAALAGLEHGLCSEKRTKKTANGTHNSTTQQHDEVLTEALRR